MTLRTILICLLIALGVGGLALYLGLTGKGGVSVPGGQGALVRLLEPYAAPSSLDISAPRIAYEEDAQAVVLTTVSLAMRTRDERFDVEVRDVRAVVGDGALVGGALRFKSVDIGRVQIAIRLDAGSDAAEDKTPSPKEIMAALHEGYRDALDQLGFEDFSHLNIAALELYVQRGDETLYRGAGELTLRTVSENVELATELAWFHEAAPPLEGKSALHMVGSANQPLEIAVDVSLQEAMLDLALFGGPAATLKIEQAALKADLASRAVDEGEINVSLTGRDITVSAADAFDGPRIFEEFVAKASYRPQDDEAALALEETSFGGAKAAGFAQVKAASSDTPDVFVEAAIRDLSVQALKDFWPISVGPGGRIWVAENITLGRVPRTDIRFKIAPEDWAQDDLPSTALTMRFQMEDITAHYRRPMQPLIAAGGLGVLTLDDVKLDIESGTINGVDASRSRVVISPFSTSPQVADIDLRIVGPSKNLTQVLDSKPLEYLSVYELSPDSFKGDVTGRARLQIPLLKAVLLDEIDLSARVDATVLTLTDIIPSEPINLEDVVIDVTKNWMTVSGDMKLDGISGDVNWREDFTGARENPTEVSMSGEITDARLIRDMPSLAGAVAGTAFFDATVLGRGVDVSNGQLNFDLNPLALRIKQLGWSKDLGTSGRAFVQFSADSERLTLQTISASADGLTLSGEAEFGLSNGQNSIRFSTFDVGRTRASVNLSSEGEDWLLAATALELDLAPLISAFWEGDLTEAPQVEASDPNAPPEPIVSISLNAENLLLDNGQRASKTRFLGRFRGDRVLQLNAFGQGPNDAPFTFTIEPIEDLRRITLAAEDAGGLAYGLDMLTNAEGGKLSLQATTLGSGDGLLLSGLLQMTDVRVLETPILARLLTLGSLTGLADLARDGGIAFKSIDVPFELVGGIVRIQNAAANGPAVGITANGEFLDSLGAADIRGVIVPAYSINSALGRVPVIGDVLMGGDNTGLFGINYKVSGALADPDLSVNPASVLTPGFLRGVFGRQKGKLKDVDLPAEKAEAPVPVGTDIEQRLNP